MSELVTERVVYEFNPRILPQGSLVKITFPRYEDDWNGIIGCALSDRFDAELEPQIKTVAVGGVVEWEEDRGNFTLLVRVPMDDVHSMPAVAIEAEDVHTEKVKIVVLWRNDL